MTGEAISEAVEIARIVVPSEGRRDMGNVLPLAASIQEVGLLHPLVLNSRMELIAGRRRLAAVKRLGWAKVPVRIVKTLDDATAALHAERDENFFREPLSGTELVELGKRLEALEKPKAKERQKAGGGKPGSGKLPQPEAKTRDKVAAAVGVSGKTYEKAKQVAQAAEQEPEKFGDLPARMDATSVDAAHRELRTRAEQPETTTADEVAVPPPVVPVQAADEKLVELAEELSERVDDLFEKMSSFWDTVRRTHEGSATEDQLSRAVEEAQLAMTRVGWATDCLGATLLPDWSMRQVDLRMKRKKAKAEA